jgi:hypothetical protein
MIDRNVEGATEVNFETLSPVLPNGRRTASYKHYANWLTPKKVRLLLKFLSINSKIPSQPVRLHGQNGLLAGHVDRKNDFSRQDFLSSLPN